MKTKSIVVILTIAAMCVLGGCSNEDPSSNGNATTGLNSAPNSQGSSVSDKDLASNDGTAANDGTMTNDGTTANNGTTAKDGNTSNNGTMTNNGNGIFDNLFKGSKIENGTYRGAYVDDDTNEISIEFVIKDNKFESVTYRALEYKDEDYLDSNATGVKKAVRQQYEEAANYLVGKNISSIRDLYKPGNIVKDVDTVTGATLRSNKLISAIWDGINRHPYKLYE